MAMQLGQAGVDINSVLGGRQQAPQQQQHQAPAQAQQPQPQMARLPVSAPVQQRGPTPPQQQGWQGGQQAAAALNPGSREFRPGQGLGSQQHPGARGMVSRRCTASSKGVHIVRLIGQNDARDMCWRHQADSSACSDSLQNEGVREAAKPGSDTHVASMQAGSPAGFQQQMPPPPGVWPGAVGAPQQAPAPYQPFGGPGAAATPGAAAPNGWPGAVSC